VKGSQTAFSLMILQVTPRQVQIPPSVHFFAQIRLRTFDSLLPPGSTLLARLARGRLS
jgi:hypothetical protein